MRSLPLLALFLLIGSHSFSQSLEGEWKGSFETAGTSTTTKITLYFTQKKDSSYKIYSYTQFKEYDGAWLTVVCHVACTRISADSIYLEETKVAQPKDYRSPAFQKMSLAVRTRDGKRILEGVWKDTAGSEYGTIYFAKK